MSQDKIGVDQWVEQYDQRVNRASGLRGFVEQTSRRLPVWGWLIVMVVFGFLLPLVTDNGFVIRIAGNIALMATLGLGLNVVVGYAGLLDLGFVAFYGIGAYVYAYLSSDFTGVHLPTWATLVIVVVVSGLFGLLLGSPSLRLLGDYLAIVTLGFGQIFTQLATSLNRVDLPGRDKPVDLTGGPNGILNLDPLNFFGLKATSVVHYYLIFLVVLAVMVLVIYHLYKSRIGRAWRAMREDELAAEAMGMPTRQLKLQAFAVGAAIAGLSGALFAAWQGSVFPGNFDTTLLITVYAIIVLGGLGSLPGVLLGALIMIAVPDILRNAPLAGTLFYIGVVVTVFAVIKPRWHAIALVVAIALFGFIVRAAAVAADPTAFAAFQPAGAFISDTVRSWLPIPNNAVLIGNYGFTILIVAVLVVSRIKPPLWRLVALVPTIYLLLFVWETRLAAEPSITRLLLVGVLLIVLMIYRPNGLVGQRRVEIA
ncbi:MAG: branched-chain amino acid ABC transporter permease [Chloroflexota bacterium]